MKKYKVKTSSDKKGAKLEYTMLEVYEHPNIVKCFDAWKKGDTFNLVMEYAEGGDLK